jgi:hypothetical protein
MVHNHPLNEHHLHPKGPTPKGTPKGTPREHTGRESGHFRPSLVRTSTNVAGGGSRPGSARGMRKSATQARLDAVAAAAGAPSAEAAAHKARLSQMQRSTSDCGTLLERQQRVIAQEEDRLDKLKNEQPLAVRLGQALMKQSLRAIDLLRSWDVNGDGEISRDEFETAVSACPAPTIPVRTDRGLPHRRWPTARLVADSWARAFGI